MAIVYLSLGSNLGNRQQLIGRAIEKIKEQIGTVVRQSALFETEPWGFSSSNKFLNAAVCVETNLTPRQLLQATQSIEQQLGRTHKTPAPSHSRTLSPSSPRTPQYSDRPIDIDILLYDNLRVDEPDLQIPHPLMHQRDFVMKPLRQILESSR